MSIGMDRCSVSTELLLAIVLAACGGKVNRATAEGDEIATLGEVCVADAEDDADFSGFSSTELWIDTNSAACDTGVCLVHRFQGRVGCPYGQTNAERTCRTSLGGEPVIVPVEPQLVARPPRVASTCSCACAGPGSGPFCVCPSGMQCAAVVHEVGHSAAASARYCVPEGSADAPLGADVCDARRGNCDERALSE